MQSKLPTRIFWFIVVIAALGLIVYIFDKAASAVPFPLSEMASTTQQAENGVGSKENGENASTSDSVSATSSASIIGHGSNTSLLPSPYSFLLIHAPLVASSSEQQSLGLGQRDSLPAGEGMLFPFSAPGNYGFWMKDMRFPLDMVWVLPDKTVAGVTADIPADSYPTVFFPPLPISYVLELNRGDAAALGIATGTQLVF
jgi:uncharacterized membrane protein (UPF0127 family)